MEAKKVKETTGGCGFKQISPKQVALGPSTKAIKLKIPYIEALKLHIAIQSCVLRLNSYDRNTAGGQQSALGLVIYLDKQRVRIIEENLASPEDGNQGNCEENSISSDTR